MPVGILDFMKDTFDTLPNTAQPTIDVINILNKLVWAAKESNQVVGLVEDLVLPFQADEAIVGEELAAGKVIDDRFGRQAFTQVGRHQVINNQNAYQGCQDD